MNCPECKRLSDECDRLQVRRNATKAAIEAAAVIHSLPEYLAAHAAMNDTHIGLRLAQEDLQAHLRFQHSSEASA